MIAPYDSRPDDGSIDLAREAAFTIGTMPVQPASREVIISGQPENLEPRVMRVLVLLARRRGIVISRDELIQRCWDGRVVGDDAINRCIARIRRLSESGLGFTVDTIPRVGYRLSEIPSSIHSQPNPVVAEPAASQRDLSPGDIKPQRHVMMSALIICALCIVAGAYWLLQHDFDNSTENVVQNVAVLSFVSLNSDPESQHFADSISSAIATALNRAGVPVVPTAASFSYRGDNRSHAGKELKARYVIDGEVRRDGDTVRVTVRVDDGRGDYTLLTNSFEATIANQSKLPIRSADYVASYAWTFRMRQLANASPEITTVYFHAISRHLNDENLAAFLEARTLANKYPNDALAQSLFAYVTSYTYWQIPQTDLEEALLAARHANKRAMELDPKFGDTRVASARLIPLHYWEEMEKQLRQGMSIDPDATLARSYLPVVLSGVGRFHDAEAIERAAIERDPFFASRAPDHYMLLTAVEDNAGAAEILARAEEYWPDNKSLIVARFVVSDFRDKNSEAWRLMRDPVTAKILEPLGTKPVVSTMMRAMATRQKKDIDAASDLCGADWVSDSAAIACLSGFNALGRLDLVFAYAELQYPEQRAATPQLEDQHFLRREVGMYWPAIFFNQQFAALHADPRFIQLTERIGVMDYWRKTHNYPDFCASEHVPVCDAMKNIH